MGNSRHHILNVMKLRCKKLLSRKTIRTAMTVEGKHGPQLRNLNTILPKNLTKTGLLWKKMHNERTQTTVHNNRCPY